MRVYDRFIDEYIDEEDMDPIAPPERYVQITEDMLIENATRWLADALKKFWDVEEDPDIEYTIRRKIRTKRRKRCHLKVNAPCMNCPDRHEACHDSCKKYKEFKIEYGAEKAYFGECVKSSTASSKSMERWSFST